MHLYDHGMRHNTEKSHRHDKVRGRAGFAVLENACADIGLDYFTHEKSRIALCLGVLLGDDRSLCAAWPASTAEIYDSRSIRFPFF